MRSRKLIILLAWAIALGGLAYWMSGDRASQSPREIGERVLPNLPVNDIAKIVIASPDRTTTVARIEGVWRLPDKHLYPADFGKLKDGLLKAAEMKIGQVARLSDEQRGRVRMRRADETGVSPEEAGTLVTFFDAGGKSLATLLVGAARERQAPPEAGGAPWFGGLPDGQYVSRDGGRSVYLVTDSLDHFSADAKDWLDTNVASVPADDIEAITITGTNGVSIDLVREQGTMVVQGLPDDRETDPNAVYSIESALSFLRFDDVADPSLTDADMGLDHPATWVAATRDRIRYTARIGAARPDGGRYFRLSATETDAGATGAASGQTDEQAKEAAAARALKIRDLNAQLGSWTYVIPAYRAANMTPSGDGLTRVKSATEEASTEEAAPAPAEAGEAPLREAPTPQVEEKGGSTSEPASNVTPEAATAGERPPEAPDTAPGEVQGR